MLALKIFSPISIFLTCGAQAHALDTQPDNYKHLSRPIVCAVACPTHNVAASSSCSGEGLKGASIIARYHQAGGKNRDFEHSKLCK